MVVINRQLAFNPGGEGNHESQPEQEWDNPKNPENAEDMRDIEQVKRQAEESERRKENLTDTDTK